MSHIASALLNVHTVNRICAAYPPSQSMYHPAGVCLVLVGNIGDEEMQQLLTRLDTVVPDEKLPRNQPRVAWTLPSPQLQSSEHRYAISPSSS